jgi:hypothetical protein
VAAVAVEQCACESCGTLYAPEVDGQTHCFACAYQEVFADFGDFCELLVIRTKEDGIIPFGPDTWNDEQRRFVAERTGRDTVLKARQIGFSTIELARDLWYALTHPGSQVLVVGQGKTEAQKLFRTVKLFCNALDKLGLLPPRSYDNVGEVAFSDPLNSSIQVIEAGATTESASKKGRSGTIHRLHATEVAFWGAAHETMKALMSACTSSAEVIIESTPNGAGGLFYDDVTAARVDRSGYKLHFYAWFHHAAYSIEPGPDFDPTPQDEWEEKLRAQGCTDGQIAWWRAKVNDPKTGLEAALQEYPVDIDSCFRASGDAWLDAKIIDRLAKHIAEPVRMAPMVWEGRRFDDAAIFAEPKAGAAYVVFGDVAEGVARDGSAAVVMEARSTEVVATFWSDGIEPGDFGAVLGILGWIYNTALVGWERNNHGHATGRAIRKEVKYPRLYVAKDGKYGWDTNPQTRPVLWEDLAAALRAGTAHTPDAEMVAECRTIIRDEDGRPRARGKKKKSKDASRDDRFVAWAGANQIRESALQRRGSFHIPGL